MNSAMRASAAVIEESLSEDPAFRTLAEGLYVLREGSAFVAIQVVPRGQEGARVRFASILVEELRLSPDLASRLLRLNLRLPFGAFAYDPGHGSVVLLCSIPGGPTLDPAEVRATLVEVAKIADQYDDGLADHYGGQRPVDRFAGKDEEIHAHLSEIARLLPTR